MSSYAGKGKATLLRNNQQARAWDGETPPTNGTTSLSAAFELERINRSFYPWGCSAEVSFASDPGVFEIDIMGADDDNPNNYNKLGTITAVNATFVGRWDMGNALWPKFVAAYMKSRANSVACSLTFTR